MELQRVVAAFAALGQETRIELLRALINAGSSGLPASDIAGRLGIPSSTLSFHLKALEQTGLIAATRHGRSLVYAAQIAQLGLLMAFLAETCRGGGPGRVGDFVHVIAAPTGEHFAMSHTAFNVLFLCTRNSARSIMAEAILSQIAQGRFNAFSAGSEPAPEGPLPEVLAQLKALGHDVSGLRSKSWDEFLGTGAPSMDFVITLCDTLNGQVCPDFGATTVTAAWPLPDPAKFIGKPAERAALLNELYAGLSQWLVAFTSLPVTSLDQMTLKARIEELADPHALARG